MKKSNDCRSIHQCLHGYSDGHRLLASSISLDDEILRIVGRLSDLSGPGGPKGFEEYLTGYPLVAMDAYALAYTWYAPEMPRPGCVWTHTLIIPRQVVSEASSLRGFLRFFMRPQSKSVGPQYRVPVYPDSSGDPRDLGTELPPMFDRSKLATILDAYYGNPVSPVIVPASGAAECLEFAIALWSQQWPDLRMRTAFSTGSLSSRTLSSRPFDLQFVPSGLAREILRESSLGDCAVLVDFKKPPARWARLASDSVAGYLEHSFWTFLDRVVDVESDRSSFERFAKVFQLAESREIEVHVGLLVTEIALLFPLPTDGSKLKSAILGERGFFVLSEGFTEIEILRSLAKAESYRAFSGSELSLFERSKRLWQTSPSDAQQFFLELLSRHLNPLAESIVSGIIAGFDAVRAQDLAETQPQLLPLLFAANPELASSSTLWSAARSKQCELFDSIQRCGGMQADAVASIVAAMMESRLELVATRVFEQWGPMSVHAALDWAEDHDYRLQQSWFSALARQPEAVLGWSGAIAPSSTETVVFLSRLLSPTATAVRDFDVTRWIESMSKGRTESTIAGVGRLYAFLIALALNNESPAPLKLVSAAFSGLHEELAADRLSYEDWALVERYTADLNWFRQWDKCERLRRGLVIAFLKHSWPAEALLECVEPLSLLHQVSLSAREVDGGKRVIKDLIRRVEAGLVHASEGQLKALRKK